METVIYEKKGHVAWVILNRPQQQNAFNLQMIRELGQVWVDVRDNPQVRVAILTGAGERHFCTGNDMEELARLGPSALEQVADVPNIQMGTIRVHKPLIAAINGWAIGSGLELALACDILIASENAKLAFMGPKAGMAARVPGGPSNRRLFARIPLGMLMEMLFTGNPVMPRDAYRVGLVNRVVPLSHLRVAAEKLAESIIACPQDAQQKTKEQTLADLYG